MLGASYFGPTYFGGSYFGGAAAVASGTPGTRPLEATFAARDFAVLFHDDPLMPNHVIITEGETREPIAATLYHTDDGELARLPLAGATVTLHLREIEAGTEHVDVAVTIVNGSAGEGDADAGDVEIPLDGLDGVAPGQYEARFKADFGGGQVQWWPTKGALAVTVRPKFTSAA